MDSNLWQVVKLAHSLGWSAFGGPAAHIAMLQQEVVTMRKWLTEEQFLDLLGATNLIPGPNSTEMVIHVCYTQAGLAGLVLGGIAFISPAVLLVTLFAWAYVTFETLPQIGSILFFVKPVVIVLILQALLKLGEKAFKGWLTGLIGLTSLILFFLGVDELFLIITGGLTALLLKNSMFRSQNKVKSFISPMFIVVLQAALQSIKFSSIFWIFLKIGSILYGSGYVLVAFLHSDLIERLGWISEQQLLDAIAVGQLTPGPVFTTATFVGYLLQGLPGALIATLGIFLPSFVFVAITGPWVLKMRSWKPGGDLLDGVNAAALGLMAAVTIQLTLPLIPDWRALLIGGISALLLFRFKVSGMWIVLGAVGLRLITSFVFL